LSKASAEIPPFPSLKKGSCEKFGVLAVTPVKTGVQLVRKARKTQDSGLRRNDVKRNQINFFTASGGRRGDFRRAFQKAKFT
jgi:hypothetical protein